MPSGLLLLACIVGVGAGDSASARGRKQSHGWPAEVPATRLRIQIAEHGIYELDFDALQSAGVPVGDMAFDPRTIRVLFDDWQPQPLHPDATPASWEADHALREAEILVFGEDDGRFDQGDRVVFYALGPDSYVDLTGAPSDSLSHFEHPYDDDNYAWLVWGDDPGQRMSVAQASLPDSSSEPIATRGWSRQHVEENVAFDTVDDLWYWAAIRDGRPFATNIELDLGGESAVDGNLRIGIGAANAWYGTTHSLQVRFNGQFAGDILWEQPEVQPPTEYFDFPLRLLSSNQLEIALNAGSAVGATTLLIELDLTWDRVLTPRGGGTLQWSAEPAPAARIYELSGFGDSEPFVLDVSDPLRPRYLIGPSPRGTGNETLWHVRDEAVSTSRTHYHAATAPRLLQATALTLRQVTALRDRASAPDMLIVTHETLIEQAQRLAEHRRAHFPDSENPEVLVVTTSDVYDNFSGGRMDPLAIRNFVKFLWNRSLGSGRPRYLLLFGDGTRDPRRWKASSGPTLVPTVHPWYADPATRRAYPVEDWFVAMDPLANPNPIFGVPSPSLAVGRMPVSTSSQAQNVVDKIIAFETAADRGAWRTRALLAADDECNPRGCRELFFIEDTETIADLIPDASDTRKIYLTEYPNRLGQKPEARADFIRAWNEGNGVVYFWGHSGPSQLADEVLFLSSDVVSLGNGTRLPLFVNLGMTGAFDSPYPSMGEQLLMHTQGGAVGVIAATTLTFASPSVAFSHQLFGLLFDAVDPLSIPPGHAVQSAKVLFSPSPSRLNESFVFLGDPAMRLLAPDARITFVNADTLYAGRRTTIEGIVHMAGDSLALETFNGQAELLVRASVDTQGYTSVTQPTLHIDYELPGVAIFRGEVPVQNGRFVVEFTVPPVGGLEEAFTLAPDAVQPGLGARSRARVERPRQTIEFGSQARVRAYAWSGDQDAQGGRNDVVFLSASGATNATSEEDAEGRAADQATAEATVEQTAAFLPERTALFQNAPNPCNSTTTFRFDLARAARAELRIYDAKGKLVKMLVNAPLERRRHVVVWNGLDDRGTPVANGIYFYRLQSAHFTQTRKLLLLR